MNIAAIKQMLIGVVVSGLATVSAFAQFTPESTGTTPFGSYSGGAVDSVDMASGSLSIHIPLFSLPQKGKLALSFSLRLTPDPYTENITCNQKYAGCQAVYLPGSQLLSDMGETRNPIATGFPGIYWDQEIASLPLQAPTLENTYQWATGVPDGYSGNSDGEGGGYFNNEITSLETLAFFSDFSSIQDGGGQVHPMGFDSTNPHLLRALDGSGYTMGDIDSNTYQYTPPNSGPPYSFFSPSSAVFNKDGVVWTGLCGATGTASTLPAKALIDPMGNTIFCGQNEQMLDPVYHFPMPELIDSVQRHVPLGGWMTSTISGCPDLTSQIQDAGARSQPLVGSAIWTVPGPTGTASYTICYASVSFRTKFFGNLTDIWRSYYYYPPKLDGSSNSLLTGSAWFWDFTSDYGGNGTQIQSVVLPNGSYWGFIYDSGGVLTTHRTTDPIDPAFNNESYGSVVRLLLPAGGSISYTYATVTCWTCGNSSSDMPWMHLKRVVTSRTVTDSNGNVARWDYARNGTLPVIETGPAVNGVRSDTVHTFNCCSPGVLYETQTDQYQGLQSAGQLLKSTTTTYQYALDPQSVWHTAMTGAVDVLPHQVSEYVNGALQRQTTYGYQNLFRGVSLTCDLVEGQAGMDALAYGCTSQPRNVGHPSNAQIVYPEPTQVTVTGASGEVLSNRSTTYLFSQNSGYLNANLLDLPSETQMANSVGPSSDTRYYYDQPASLCSPSGQPGPYGNLTSVQQWSSTDSAWLPTSSTYNCQGMRSSTTDAMSNTTNIYYANSGIFPNKIQHPSTNGVAHIDYYAYDDNAGLVTSHTDWNGTGPGDAQHTATYLYDVMGRPTSARYPDGGGSSFCYTDIGGTGCSQSGPPYKAFSSQTIDSSKSRISVATYDGLGRVVKSVLTSDSAGADETDTTYDALGRVSGVSNPYRSTSDPTYGWTTYLYDALGRKTGQHQSDGVSILSWLYSGPTVTSTDEAGVQMQHTTDGLGRLTQVVELGTTASPLSLTTLYNYDTLGNLSTVSQNGGSGNTPRARNFSYDSLSRLLTSTNPETGTICYGQWSGSNCINGYDANGNLQYKTDARGVVTHYTYDNLNRLLSKTYPAGTASACYQYDSSSVAGAGGNLIGRLTNKWTQAGACPSPPSPPATPLTFRSYLSYDAMGRLLNERQCTRSNCGTTSYAPSYTYDLAGHIITHTNGTGAFTFTDSYDAAGRLASVVSNNTQYISNLFTVPTSVSVTPCNSTTSGQTQSGYSPAGGLMNATFGYYLQLNRGYDTRLRTVCETDIGNSVPAQTPGAATITILGSDQAH